MIAWICPVCKEEVNIGVKGEGYDKAVPAHKCGVQPRKPILFDEADPDKIVVSMVEHKGEIIVATKKGVYMLTGGVLVRIKFIEKDD